jgi:hypothetical protein
MMAMLDLIDDGGELAAVPAVQAGAEYSGNLVSGEPPQAEFTTSLEQLVDGKVAPENENRDRGAPHDTAPPTPPYVRVRIRRFGELCGLRARGKEDRV